MSLSAHLQWAREQLQSTSDSAALDAEIILMHLLQISRSHLLAFPERQLTTEQSTAYKKLILQRSEGMPVAYLTGHREFWSLNFVVTRDTLIPRPETELLVELVLQNVTGENKFVADLGTGSGAIALALAHERPHWKIYATDKSPEALKIAALNAERLNINNVCFQQGEWFAPLKGLRFDVIVSNPPYIAADDPHLQQADLRFEPESALVAAENGLSDLHHLIHHAKPYLQLGGKVFVEHGYQQASSVRDCFKAEGYTDIKSYQDLAGIQRVTGATMNETTPAE